MDPVGNNISPSFIFIGEKYCFVHKEFSELVGTFGYCRPGLFCKEGEKAFFGRQSFFQSRYLLFLGLHTWYLILLGKFSLQVMRLYQYYGNNCQLKLRIILGKMNVLP